MSINKNIPFIKNKKNNKIKFFLLSRNICEGCSRLKNKATTSICLSFLLLLQACKSPIYCMLYEFVEYVNEQKKKTLFLILKVVSMVLALSFLCLGDILCINDSVNYCTLCWLNNTTTDRKDLSFQLKCFFLFGLISIFTYHHVSNLLYAHSFLS